jgi:phosphoglycolate phosphatase-like HAD superfamily hydrolase
MSNSTLNNLEFPWISFDAFLFDIDGTLLNCRDAVHYDAFHCALREVWRCEQKIDGVPLHGNTDPGILRAAAVAGGIGEERFLEGLPEALAIMQSEVERHAGSFRPELCPSIVPLLARLHAAGKLLGVTSGAGEPVGWAKLRAAGIAQYFAFGSFSTAGNKALRPTRVEIFRDGVRQVRASLGEAAAICFVGDTPADIAAARALRVPILAVATGIFDWETLRREGPDYCLPSCDRLLAAEPR